MIGPTGGTPSLTGVSVLLPDRFHQPNFIRDSLANWATSDFNHTAACVFHSYKLPAPPANEAPLPAFPLEPLKTDDTLLAAAFDAYILSQNILCLHVGFADLGPAFLAKWFASVRHIPAAAITGVGGVLIAWICRELVSAGLCDCVDCHGVSPSVRQLTENAYQVDMKTVMASKAGLPDEAGLERIILLPSGAEPQTATMMWRENYKRCALVSARRDARLADKPMTVRPIKREAVIDAGPSVYTSDMAPLEKGQLAMSDILSVYDKAPSSKNVLDLDEITIDKMQCPLVHAGQCITLRVITPPAFNGTGIALYAEDALGNAIIVRVQFPLPRPARYYPMDYVQRLYPLGSFMTVKEPYVHFSPTAAVPEIDIGWLSDMVLLPAGAGMSASFDLPFEHRALAVEELREQGRELFVKESFLAYRSFDRALHADNLDPADKLSLLLNRALAGLYSNQPGAAWRDYLAIDQLVGSGATRMTPAQQAKYDKRREEAMRRLGLDDDASSDKSTAITTLGSVPGRGLATIAVRDLVPGDMFPPTSPLVVTSPEPTWQWDFWYQPDLTHRQISTNGWFATAQAVHGAMDDPRKGAQWLTFHPRSSADEIEAAKVTVDRPFGGQVPLSCLDIARKYGKNSQHTTKQTVVDGGFNLVGAKRVSTEIEATYSMMNHSCIPNAIPKDNGPFMMLDYVKKGEEVLTSYALKGASYIERQRNLRGWGFTCTCKLCTLDAADDHQRREQLMHFEFPRIGNNADGLKRLAEEVERTYAKGRTLKPDAARVYSALAESEKLSDLSRFEYGKMALACAGTVFTPRSKWSEPNAAAIETLPLGIIDVTLLATMLGLSAKLGRKHLSRKEFAVWSNTRGFVMRMFGYEKLGSPSAQNGARAQSMSSIHSSSRAKVGSARQGGAPILTGISSAGPAPPLDDLSPLDRATLREIVDSIPEEERIVNQGVKVLPNGERVAMFSMPGTAFNSQDPAMENLLGKLGRLSTSEGEQQFVDIDVQSIDIKALLRQYRESQEQGGN